MRRPTFSLLATVLAGLSLVANDGIDRYRKAVPSTFRLFPAPTSPRAGYGVLDRDMEGGADGEVKFRWVQPHVVALVRVVSHTVAKELGSSAHPLLVFDASAENGDTPVEFNPKPIGRHPGGSHDGGLNLDLGYYLTSVKGKVYTPDFSAGTEHFERAADGTLKDVPILLGPADRLDVPRQTLWFAELFRIHDEQFGRDLLEQIGVDYEVRKAVMEQAKTWARTKRYGLTADRVAEMDRVLTSDPWDGWARTHHHHLHLRVRDLPLMGHHRTALEQLMARDRQILATAAGATPTKPALEVALLSADLSRSLEVELLPTHAAIQDAAFRLDGGPWVQAQPGNPRHRAVLSLPEGFQTDSRTITIEARFSPRAGQTQTLTSTQILPPKEAYLAVGVEAARLSATVVADGTGLRLTPHMPAAYGVLVTDLAWVVHRRNQAPQVVKGARVGEASALEDRASISLVELQATCSSRRAVRVVVFGQ